MAMQRFELYGAYANVKEQTAMNMPTKNMLFTGLKILAIAV